MIELRDMNRDGGVVDASDNGNNGGQGDSRATNDAFFEQVLQQAVVKCKAVGDYLQASLLFTNTAGILRKFGCPERLIDCYDLQVAEFYGRKNAADNTVRNLIELVMDNHGSISHKEC